MTTRFDVAKAACARASEAFNPDTGDRVPPNVLRISPGRNRVCKWRPTKVYREFAPGMTRMSYAQLLTRLTSLENAHPSLHRVTYGTSEEGRELFAYRIGPSTKPQILFTLCVHGNEVDGAEGMFSLMEDLMDGEHADLASILEQWSIWVIPSCNPDGWFYNERDLQSIGPNGQNVNLNRCWPWFWDDFIPSSFESKGFAPAGVSGDNLETRALYNFITDPAKNIKALFDHHANIGQGARYVSRNRIQSWNPAWRNRDWDIYRLQGAIRKQRGPNEIEFVQFRRSKTVPHLHTWAGGQLGMMSLALESRKDEPMGPTGACIWEYDSSIACLVSMTDAMWEDADALLVEREATNLVTQVTWDRWSSGNTAPEGSSRSRILIEPQGEVYYPHDAKRIVKVTNELEVDPTEPTPDWQLCTAGDLVMAVGRLPSTPGHIQSVQLGTETVETKVGPFGASPTGATRRFGLVRMQTIGSIMVYGGWSDDGLTLYKTGFGLSVVGGILGVDAVEMPIELADMGHATDNSRYSVFVGGSTGTPSSAFTSTLTGKILRFDSLFPGGGWTDTGLTIPARKHATVVFRPGTNEFYIFGGQKADGSLYDDIWVYDRAANTVTELGTTLPLPMAAMGGAYWDTRIFLYGGIQETAPATYSLFPYVQRFTPSSGALITLDEILANLEDESSHDTATWSRPVYHMAAANRAEATGDLGEIFLIGGFENSLVSPDEQLITFKHEPESDTITTARDGVYSLFSRLEDITVTPGQWYSMSTFVRSGAEGEPFYFRACMTFKTSTGKWNHHGRTYYEIPPADRFQWIRTAAKAFTGEDKMRPYFRGYVEGARGIYERPMVCNRSRAASYHPTTREADTLEFAETLDPNNFRVRFIWNPTFGFINVGEDLEIARVGTDANNYVAVVLLLGTPDKTYHNSQQFTAPRYPEIALRKVRGGVQEADLRLVCYYGYDCRSSNQEGYDDIHTIVMEHIEGQRLGFGIDRYGAFGWNYSKSAVVAFSAAPGKLSFTGEGYYGVPEYDATPTIYDPVIGDGVRDLGAFGFDARDCIHPGEPDAR